MSQPKLVYVVTEDWYFWSHRVDVARLARQAGFEVYVATRTTAHADRIAAEGFTLLEMPFERSLRHPLRDLRAGLRLAKDLAALEPQVVHLVSLKPILLSALAVRRLPRTAFLHAFTGLGYLFSSADRRARGLQQLVVACLRWLLRRANCHILVQNADDLRLLRARGLGAASRTHLIPGSGVDCAHFTPAPLPMTAAPICVLPARLIRDKGIDEFVAAARLVKATHPEIRCVLVGGNDADNPAAIPPATIASWVAEGVIEWWGHRDDMREVYAAASVVCLPSYREGLPKALLEAAACGRPLVATDVPGCRDICRDRYNGLLVPPRNAEALARALLAMLESPAQMAEFGRHGRALAEAEFATQLIGARTLVRYRQLMDV